MSFGKKSSSQPKEEPKGLPGGTWTGDPATSTPRQTAQKAESMATATTPSLLATDDEERRRQQSLLG